MSNYHGVPNFGVPFNYNGHYPPPMPPPSQQGGPYGLMPQPVYPQHHGPPSIPPPQNFQSPHFSTQYNYNTNAPFPSGGLPGSGAPPPPPYTYHTNFGAYAANGMPPPPPFPPLPIPNHNSSSQRPAASTVLPASSRIFTPQTGLPPKPTSNVEMSHHDMENGDAPGISGEDREDGELSDAGRCRTISETGSIKSSDDGKAVQPRTDSQTHQPTLSSTNDITIPVFESLAAGKSVDVAKARFRPQKDREISDSREHSLSSQFSYDGLIKETDALRGIASPKIAQPVSSTILKSPKTNSRYYVIRAEAKSALLDLHRADIGYKSLVAEGFNPSLLRGLYQDIGLEVVGITTTSRTISPTEQILKNNIALTSPSIESRSHTNPASKSLSTAEFAIPTADLSQPIEARPPLEVSLNKVVPGISKSSNLPMPAVSEASKERQNIPRPVSASQPTKSTGANTVKSPSILMGGDRTLERKDYIAKMLAAKAAKGASAKTTKVTEQVKAMRESGSTQEASKESTIQGSDDTSLITASVHSYIQIETEAKKKASTDLARRKMEALKTQSNEGRGLPPASATLSQSPAKLAQDSSSASSERRVKSPARSPMPINTQIMDQPAAAPTPSSQQYTPLTPFFAKLERNSFIGLPGLTMPYTTVSSPLAQPETIVPSPVISSPAQQVQGLATNSVVQRRSPSLPPAQITATQPSLHLTSSADVSVSEVTGNVHSETTAVSGSRKRPTAADFIDGPSHSLKRTSGSNGHVEVVIEISEDEGLIDDDEMDIEITSPNEVQATAQTLANRAKPIRDLLPLSNFPSQPNPAGVSSTSTPPLVQIPGKSSEPEELARAEEKIRLLKQMIAQKEERQRAKWTSSRAQSPGLTTNTVGGAPLARDASPARTSSGSLAIEQKKRVLDAVRQDLEDRKSILTATETAVQGRLEAEEIAHAAVAARAEVERLEAAKATNVAERQYRENRRAVLEAALPELDTQIRVAKEKLDGLRSQKEELEAELERGSEGRRMILEELDDLLATLDADKSMQELTSVQPAASNIRAESASTHDGFEAIQSNFVKSNRQATSPLSIPSTVTPIPIDGDDEQPALSTNGVLSRSGTADQIMDISSPSSDSTEPIGFDDSSPSQSQLSAELGTGYEEYEPRLEDDLLLQQTPGAASSMPLVVDELLNDTAQSPAEPTADLKGNVLPRFELSERDEISLEDGEVSRSISPNDADDSDDYEPPEPLPVVDNSAVSQESEVFSPKSSVPQAEVGEQGQGSDEPLIAARESPFAVDLTVTSPTGAKAPNTPEVTPDSAGLQTGHFTPYESPLNIFSSYRYHPKYVSEVSEGFRSLTYSHKIDPKEPLCRWELAGGICNDNSCMDQHFKNMQLTDDMILVQLGSVHEGSTTEERTAYVSGLKRIISDMRSRRVTDFNTVAQEITAYRASFLGDSSRILTL